MFMETPQTLIYLVGGAFLLGWLVGKIGAYFGNRFAAKKSDPRDGRIRSLDADVRVAQTEAEKSREDLEERDKELAEQKSIADQHDAKIKEQAQTIARLRADLKDSVKKTRELRTELSDRATENVRSEVKLREVQTELSVAHASTDMIATGVLDYSVAPGGDESEENPVEAKAAK
jgi:seryl-tRNA synthetase